MNFTKHDMKMFELAHKESQKSSFKQFPIGAVVTYKKKVIGIGHNDQHKTHPTQKKYNTACCDFNIDGGKMIVDAVHAEVAAVSSISYVQSLAIKNWEDVKIYVYRTMKHDKNKFGCAKPCPACAQFLIDSRINNVYYTDHDGYSYTHLEG